MKSINQNLLKLSTLVDDQVYRKQILKLAEENIYLYSFIPSEFEKSVFKFGLASSEYITENPELLKTIFPEKKEQEKWIKKFDKSDVTLQGPSAWFSKPDLGKILKLDKKHPLSEGDYTLIQIDWTSLKTDEPKAEIYGLELVPYKEQDYDKLESKIEHTLSDKEISKLSQLDFKETWENFLGGKGYYSANVPHGVIITPKKYIPGKYLEII